MRPLLLSAVGAVLMSVVLWGCAPSSSGSPSSPDSSVASRESVSSSDRTPASSTEETSSRAEISSTEKPRTISEKLADATVQARIKKALAGRRDLRQFDFSPEVVRGRVVLRGDVDTKSQYRRAGRITEAVDGVESVVNEVTVKGDAVSTGEEETESTSTSEGRYHTVRPGDTLTQIARTYGVSVGQIRDLNDLSSTLHPGDRLRVR